MERAVEAVTPAAHPLPRGSEHHAAMTIAYVALGANLVTPLGDAHSTLTHALDDLAQLPNTRVTACSSFYRTAPVDADGPDFINAVAALDTTLDAPALLAACLAIERLHGRTRPQAGSQAGTQSVAPPGSGHHAARTLDLDLLLHGSVMLNTASLTLPHPRMHLRAFVLAPLCEIAPQLLIPGQGPVSDCLETIGGQGVSRIMPGE